MQLREFEALSLKECLQQVRSEMGPDAVILETRKFRTGGVMGLGAHDAVSIVAATGITVDDAPRGAPQTGHRFSSECRGGTAAAADSEDLAVLRAAVLDSAPEATQRGVLSGPVPGGTTPQRPATAPNGRTAARAALRGVYGAAQRDFPASRPLAASIDAGSSARVNEPTGNASSGGAMQSGSAQVSSAAGGTENSGQLIGNRRTEDSSVSAMRAHVAGVSASRSVALSADTAQDGPAADRTTADQKDADSTLATSQQLAFLERSMGEIRERLVALQCQQQEREGRTLSAVAPTSVSAPEAQDDSAVESEPDRFPELAARLQRAGVAPDLASELIDQLPDMDAWSVHARGALAEAAVRDLISRRIAVSGPIELNQGRTKVVALLGPTGVGKTTTIAKLAANFALLEGKRVALLTVDTYRIAAVDQLRTYGQIIDLPVTVVYHALEIAEVVRQHADYDLVLIDTAGRSPQQEAQVAELQELLAAVDCERHLVLSATMKERDMVEAARRFSAVGVDRMILSKLDETTTHGSLLNIMDSLVLPLSYLTDGQKVPEDLEIAEPRGIADRIIG